MPHQTLSTTASSETEQGSPPVDMRESVDEEQHRIRDDDKASGSVQHQPDDSESAYWREKRKNMKRNEALLAELHEAGRAFNDEVQHVGKRKVSG